MKEAQAARDAGRRLRAFDLEWNGSGRRPCETPSSGSILNQSLRGCYGHLERESSAEARGVRRNAGRRGGFRAQIAPGRAGGGRGRERGGGPFGIAYTRFQRLPPSGERLALGFYFLMPATMSVVVVSRTGEPMVRLEVPMPQWEAFLDGQSFRLGGSFQVSRQTVLLSSAGGGEIRLQLTAAAITKQEARSGSRSGRSSPSKERS